MSGISAGVPKQHPQYIFRQTLNMGKTSFTRREVKNVIRKMRPNWMAKDYHLLLKNCGSFGDALCVALQVGHLPGWVTRLAEASGRLPAARQLVGICAASNRKHRQMQQEAVPDRSGDAHPTRTSDSLSGYVCSSSCEDLTDERMERVCVKPPSLDISHTVLSSGKGDVSDLHEQGTVLASPRVLFVPSVGRS